MVLKALVLSRNRRFIATFADAVADMRLDWMVSDEFLSSLDFVKREKFDYLIGDCTTEDGRRLIKEARRSEANGDCVILGIAGDPREKTLPKLGADIYIGESVNADLLAVNMRELLPLITHDQRRSDRCRMATKVRIIHAAKDLLCALLTLSEGGMMIRVDELISRVEVFPIFLPLPGISEEMELYGKVAWQQPQSLTGVRFLGLTDDQRTELRAWMQLQPSAPSGEVPGRAALRPLCH